MKKTSLAENMLSTLLGAAPFALLFAWIPSLSASMLALDFGVSSLLFVVYVRWVWRATPSSGD